MGEQNIFDKLLDRTTHLPTRRLVEALASHGWQLVTVRGGSILLVKHPNSGTELQSPDWARDDRRVWGGRTFPVHRQLSFNWDGEKDRAYALRSRQSHAPWAGAEERSLSFKAAVGYVSEEWNPASW